MSLKLVKGIRRELANLIEARRTGCNKAGYRAATYRQRQNHGSLANGMRSYRCYAQNVRSNIRELHGRLHRGQYRPRPARQVSIPKEGGSERSLSILCLEDKIVQQAVVTVLNQIYYADFLGFSYGFRPGRGQHDALNALNVAIMTRKVNWVLDWISASSSIPWSMAGYSGFSGTGVGRVVY